MKKSLRVVMVLFAFGVLFGCVNAVSGQEITGGYGEASKTDAEVVKTANFAVKAQGKKVRKTFKLVSIERAEIQVVSGLNYRLCLKVKNKDKEQEIKVIVYKNLKNKLSLTSWTEENCTVDDTN